MSANEFSRSATWIPHFFFTSTTINANRKPSSGASLYHSRAFHSKLKCLLKTLTHSIPHPPTLCLLRPSGNWNWVYPGGLNYHLDNPKDVMRQTQDIIHNAISSSLLICPPLWLFLKPVCFLVAINALKSASLWEALYRCSNTIQYNTIQ